MKTVDAAEVGLRRDSVAEAGVRYAGATPMQNSIRDALRLVEEGKISVTITITPVAPKG